MFITIILIMLCTNAHAGIDFSSRAMTSDEYYAGYEIPWFETKKDAIDWVERTKWVEPLRRMLKRKILDLSEKAYPLSKSLTPEGLKKAGELMQQVYYLDIALLIMEGYKRDKVGASFYAGSEPIKEN